MKAKSYDKRIIGLDLLKCMAIIMIITSHSVPRQGGVLLDGINPEQATTDAGVLACIFYQYNANIANLLFVMCSAVFLTRETTKFNKVRFLSIIRDNWLISVIFLVITLLTGIKCGMGEIALQFIPTLWGTNWFITTYVLYYLTVPFLNLAIKHMSQRMHLQGCLVMLFLYCGVQFVLRSKLYYTWWLGFIIIHFLFSYKEKYMKNIWFKHDKLIFALAVVGYIGLILITNYMGLKLSFMYNRVQFWNQFLNPFELIIGFCLIEWFRKFQIDSVGIKRIIVAVSMCSLEIYLIHNNYMVKTYWRPEIWETIYNTYGYEHLGVLVLLVVAATFVITVPIAYIYHWFLSKGKHRMINRIIKCFETVTDRVTKIGN